jgi:hypothetical protein
LAVATAGQAVAVVLPLEAGTGAAPAWAANAAALRK